MTKDEAIRFFGTQKALSEALGLSQPTISGWIKVPLEHQMYLEKLTRRKLRADPHPAEVK
jgi:DNA-binding transcriptional regulator YdaS (Cro superfamily)